MVRTPSRRQRALLVALTGLVSAAGAPALAAVPTAPDGITVFPERDVVSVEGYRDYAGEDVQVVVLRNGVEIGRADGILGAGEAALEVNHPGGVCWRGRTPDLRAGDEVRLLVDGWPIGREPDSVVVADVTAERARLADVDEDRQGPTVVEVGPEVTGGPGMPGCPPAAGYAVTSAEPAVLNVATQAQPLVLSGTAPGAEAVTVRLEDGLGHTVTLPAQLAGAGVARTWSVTVPADAHAELGQGRLTASAVYEMPGGEDAEGRVALVPISGAPLTLVKDTVAPPAPVLFPAPGALDEATGLRPPVRVPVGTLLTLRPEAGSERVVLHYGLGPVHVTPVDTSAVYAGGLPLTVDTRVAAAAVDAAGNVSVPVAADYLMAPAAPTPSDPPPAAPVPPVAAPVVPSVPAPAVPSVPGLPAPPRPPAVPTTAPTARTATPAPSAPVRLRAAAPTVATPVADVRAARLAWTPRTLTGVVRYEIRVYAGRTLVRTVAVPGTASSARVRALSPGKAYRFRVNAVTAKGAGTRSAYTATVVPTRTATR